MGRIFHPTLWAAVGLHLLAWHAPVLAQDYGAAPPDLLPYPNTGYAPPPLVAPSAPIRLAPPEPTPAAPPLVGESVPAPPSEPTLPAAAVEELLTAGEEPIVDLEEPARWYRPVYWFGPAPWDTGFELGINGSTGTSDTFSIRTGGYVKRKTDKRKLDLSLYYNKTTAEGTETQSNALLDGRHDWLFGTSPWTLYTMTQVFYDEFQAFDLNVNSNVGVAYQWIDGESVKLGTSLGSGASREFGGPDDSWTPEAQIGFEWEHQISHSQKFYADVDYFPEWGDMSNYRVLSDMGVEIELNRPSNVSLKISATDRYDSNPDGTEPHNTNYSVLLLWKH